MEAYRLKHRDSISMVEGSGKVGGRSDLEGSLSRKHGQGSIVNGLPAQDGSTLPLTEEEKESYWEDRHQVLGNKRRDLKKLEKE